MAAKEAGRFLALGFRGGRSIQLPFLYRTSTIERRAYHVIDRHNRGTSDGSSEQDSGDIADEFLPSQNPFEEGEIRRRSPGGRPRNRQQPEFRQPGRHNKGRRNKNFSQRSSDHVPFEKIEDNREAGLGLESSTMTPQERNAFQKLFEIKPKDKGGAARRGKENDLDTILDSAVDNIKQRDRPAPQFPASLQAMAQEAKARRQAERDSKEDAREQVRAGKIRKDLEKATALLESAETDLELWARTKKHILNRVAALELDATPTLHQQAAAKAWQKQQAVETKHNTPESRSDESVYVSDLDILTTNLPLLLTRFMQIAQTNFPASPIDLNILPTLKSLGPSAFALGATTQLYYAHIAALFTRYGPTSLPTIAEVLREMDREVYEFDEETIWLIIKTIKSAKKYRQGHGSRGQEALWSMESAGRGVKEMLSWREIVETKRQEAALRKVREEEAARAAEAEEGGDGLDGDETRAQADHFDRNTQKIKKEQLCTPPAAPLNNARVSKFPMNPSALNGTRDEDHSKRSRTQPSFRLTDLAADPRGRIYHELLTWPANDHYENRKKRSKRKPPFRLLDLTPDLRGRIYHELLTWPERDSYHLSTCQPQILTVCKQVKAEAEEILYKENTEVIQLALRQQTRSLTSCLLSVGGGRTLHRELVSTTCLEGCGWPGHLRRMGRLRVVVRMAPATTSATGGAAGSMKEMARKVNNILYSLVNFLAGSSGGAQGVEIVLQQQLESGAVTGLNLNGPLLARMLWPLSKCRAQQPLRKVSLVGFTAASSPTTASTTAARLFFEQKITGRPIHNVNLIEKYWIFEQGVKAFFGLSRGDSMAVAVVSQQQQHLSIAATQLETMALEEGWVDAVWEEGLIRALVVVGTFLKANG
ncbi:hypothetical protein KC365_g9521 [Hortaea werneckii]|nr:hypothetical protein KC365_g9521 [Hortaea werneckii]